jgi:hypothetical protein
VDPAFARGNASMSFGNRQGPTDLSGTSDDRGHERVEDVIARSEQPSILFAQLKPPRCGRFQSFNELPSPFDLLGFRAFVSARIETPLPKRRGRINLNDEPAASAI